MSETGYIDLHVHTNNSDGYFSPNEIVSLADDNNTSILSICDHDSVDGIDEFKKSLKKNMIGINGVEFSSFLQIRQEKIKLHILGYGFDLNNQNIKKLLDEMKSKRLNAHLELLEFMKKRLQSLPEESISQLNIERYCWFDREIINCLEYEKYPSEIINYYKKYFKDNKFSYGADYELDCNRVISAIKKASGYVVLAHPLAYGFDKQKIIEIIDVLSNYGIDGIEVYQSDCSKVNSQFLIESSKNYNMLCSVGSDFHRIKNSDGRMIGKGINDNLCIRDTSLTQKILTKKMYFKGEK